MSLVNKVLTKLRFSKNWNSKADFPTYEMREEQVRADIQLLHDETQTAFNTLVDDLDSLSAGNIPFASSTAVPASNLQEAVENVQRQVAEASAATIPNESITDEKMAPNVPTTKADLEDGIVKPDQRRLRIKALDTISHTLGPADAGCLLLSSQMNLGGNVSIVIPADSSNILVGSVFIFAKRGYAANIQLVFEPENVFIYSGASQYAVSPITFLGEEEAAVMLVKLSANSWFLAEWSVK